ncbi:hypothetical protein [Polluticaenibacter yanchengensis]|uniref:Uncharacterized protein n=1 Tax=Polluticaenibacter yanchengensis TaxID=3014562 RepID=A0ABT4UFN5_9BACT|nr:hypothetical protein [Chitinophagaceae bacterium LY-5]
MKENNKPLEGVIVIEEDRAENQSKTDITGYLKLNRSPDWVGRLVFIYNQALKWLPMKY